jgi:hypothetical protein
MREPHVDPRVGGGLEDGPSPLYSDHGSHTNPRDDEGLAQGLLCIGTIDVEKAVPRVFCPGQLDQTLSPVKDAALCMCHR